MKNVLFKVYRSNNFLSKKRYSVQRENRAVEVNRASFKSKHNYLMLLSLFKLTTCFGLALGQMAQCKAETGRQLK